MGERHRASELPYSGGMVMNIAGAMVAEVIHLGKNIVDYSPHPDSVSTPRSTPGLKDVIRAIKQQRTDQRWAEDISSRNIR